MIQLSSRHALVLGQEGRTRTFDFEELRRELTGCFHACGVTDSWPAESVVCAIEEHFVRQCQDGGNTISEDELHALVTSVLLASGYPDVAGRYRHQRNLEPRRTTGPRPASWDAERLTAVLRRSYLLTENATETLASSVKKALEQLTFTEVTDEFIRQLGGHILDTGIGMKPPETTSPWLFSPSQVNGAVDMRTADVSPTGAVRLYPVSRLIPRVRAELSLAHLADSIGDRPMTEMMIIPRLRKAASELRSSLPRLRERVCRERSDAQHHPAHLVVSGLDVVLNDVLVPLSRRGERAFVNDVQIVLQRDLGDLLTFELVVSYR